MWLYQYNISLRLSISPDIFLPVFGLVYIGPKYEVCKLSNQTLKKYIQRELQINIECFPVS